MYLAVRDAVQHFLRPGPSLPLHQSWPAKRQKSWTKAQSSLLLACWKCGPVCFGEAWAKPSYATDCFEIPLHAGSGYWCEARVSSSPICLQVTCPSRAPGQPAWPAFLVQASRARRRAPLHSLPQLVFQPASMGDVGGPSATSLVRKARGTAVCKPAGEQYSGHMVTELEVGPGKDSSCPVSLSWRKIRKCNTLLARDV